MTTGELVETLPARRLCAPAPRRSAELAAALGPFAEFQANREPMLHVIEQHAEALQRLGGEQPPAVLGAARREWTRALDLGRKHGFRNAQTTLIPPTGKQQPRFVRERARYRDRLPLSARQLRGKVTATIQ